VEELARGWTTVAGAVAGHLVVTWALARFGAPEVREAALPALARGERLATAALGRPVDARRDGEGWALAGTSALADNAPRAGLFLLPATDAEGRPMLALVGREAADLVIGDPEPMLGARGLDACRLVVDGVHPERVLAGAERTAPVLGVACVLAAATAVGLAQAAFEAALRYSQQRTTFGKPLCQHQAVQLKLADMATGITAARLLTYEAAATEAAGALDPAAAAMARLQAASVAVQATLESMRIHGGYGYVSEFPVERYYRDATRLLFVPVDEDALRADLAARLAAAL
jgi:alkylation response protein AidB-like acyl-CoA dehydrogenase